MFKFLKKFFKPKKEPVEPNLPEPKIITVIKQIIDDFDNISDFFSITDKEYRFIYKKISFKVKFHMELIGGCRTFRYLKLEVSNSSNSNSYKMCPSSDAYQHLSILYKKLQLKEQDLIDKMLKSVYDKAVKSTRPAPLPTSPRGV